MSGPILSPLEIAQMTKESAKAVSAAATFQSQIAAQVARAAELSLVDSAFKKFFDYYNSNIINQYDLERRQINGQYLDSPVTEADVLACASLLGNRIQPSLPATDIIRIPQFDGTPILQDTTHELQAIIDQAKPETTLVSGYGGLTPSPTILTDTSITSTSTTLKLTSATTFTIAPNSVFIIANGGDLAVVKILTFTMQVSPVPPPYVAECTIQLIVSPTGTIASGQFLTSFNGFTNAERAAKTPVNLQLQPLMNNLIAELQSKINIRISKLIAMLTPISANQDPGGTAELSQATINVNASKSFLTNYLITTNISDFGMNFLSSERSSRTTQANARVAQIVAAYTGRTKNYYNERYNAANNRANTARGSLRLQKNAEQSGATSASFAATLVDQASAIGSILP